MRCNTVNDASARRRPTRDREVIDESQTAIRNVVLDLERARRKTRRTVIDFWEAIYQAYVAGLVMAMVVAVVASLLPQSEISTAAVEDLARWGPAVLGAVVVLALYLGVRSGIHGGPLVFEAATVQYVLQSPVDRAFVARREALRQFRTAVTWGTAGGAGLGLAISASLPGNTVEFVLGFGVVGGLAGLLLFGSALVVSGLSLRPVAATTAALALLGWSVFDIASTSTTSPFTLIGRIGLWPISGSSLTFVGVAMVAAIAVVGFQSAGGFSLEASVQRSGLVNQIRFALTMNDLRTVVLLRRRLANHTYRARPWIPIPRSTGTRFPVFRRSLHSHLRLPLPAVIRIFVIGVGAGIGLGLANRGVAAFALLSGLLMLVAGFDFTEPLAQEVDNPGRWVTYPAEPGELAVRFTLSAAVSMLAVACVSIVAATAVGGLDTLPIAIVAFPVAALAAAGAAAVSTLLGVPDTAASSELFGLAVVIRIVLPPVIVVLPFAPIVAGLAAGSLPNLFLPNTVALGALGTGAALLWISRKSPGLI